MLLPRVGGTIAVMAILCLPGCHDDQNPAQRRERTDLDGPSLAQVGSLRLRVPDSVQMGAHTAFFAVGGNREVFINDMDKKRILRFSNDGQLLGVFGQEGGGPGEFELPSVLGLIAADSILVVADVARRYLSLFEVETGEYLRGLELPVRDIGANWTTLHDTIHFAVQLGTPLVSVWDWRTDSVTTLGTLPSRLYSAMPVTIRHGRTEMVMTDAGFILLIPTEPGLHLLDSGGTLTGFVPIAAARRRGEPPDLIERQFVELDAKRFGPVGSPSAALHRLSSGQLAVVHYDVDFLGNFSGSRFGNFRLYVTLLARDLAQACLDAPVSIEMDDFSMPVFVGDTMFVFVRSVTDDDRVENVVRGFLISDEGCDWVPTGGVRPPRAEDLATQE